MAKPTAMIKTRVFFLKNSRQQEIMINLFRSPFLKSIITNYLPMLTSLYLRFRAQERKPKSILGFCPDSLPVKGRGVFLPAPSSHCTIDEKSLPQVIGNLKRNRIDSGCPVFFMSLKILSFTFRMGKLLNIECRFRSLLSFKSSLIPTGP